MTQPEPMDTVDTCPAPGERLRQAREARKLTREDVAARLHLSVAKIEALERGEVAGLAAPVFLIGYLRAYSRMVELDPEEIIADFASLKDLVPPVTDPAPGLTEKGYGKIRASGPVGSSSTGWRVGLLWAVAGLVLMAVAGAWWHLRTGERASASGIAQNLGVPAAAQQTLGIPPVDQLPEDVAPGQSAAADAETPVPQEEAPVPKQEPLAFSAQLVLTLNDESWVEITDAQGKRLMHDLARAGRTYTLSGVAPFEVMLGYVAGVQMEYNGAPYDLSRFKGQRTAKFTLGAASDHMNID